MSRRHVGSWLLWALLTAGLVAAFADIRVGLPWSPERRVELQPTALVAPAARLTMDGTVVHIDGANGQGHAIVLHPLEGVDADDYRYVTLDLADMAPTLRMLFVWQVSGRLEAMPMPGAQLGAATLDLASNPAWDGSIEAVGFSLLPTDYLGASALPIRRTTFIAGDLHSDSVIGALGALATQWLAYRPWTGRSNHTAGFELPNAPGPSLQAFVLLSLSAAWLSLVVAGGWRRLRQRAWQTLAVALLTLIVWQAAQLTLRARVAVAAASAASERSDASAALSAMPALAAEVDALAAQLDRSPSARVLVFGQSEFMREYPTWLLRRFNVASLRHPPQLLELAAEHDAVLVLAGPGRWQHHGRLLEIDGLRAPVRPLFRGALVSAYRLDGRVERRQ